MKPSIDQSLIILAKELSERVTPLLESDYEVSRLNAWSALLIIIVSVNDDQSNYLLKENKEIEFLLEKYRGFLEERSFFHSHNPSLYSEDKNIKINTLKKINENLRSCFISAHIIFEDHKESEALKDSWKVLSSMQMNQGVNKLIPFLQSNND